MLRLAGRFGDGWLPGQKVTAEEYAARLADHRTRRAPRPGATATPFIATQTILVALGASRERVLAARACGARSCAAMALGAPAAAWAALGLVHPLGERHGGFLDLVPTRVGAADVDRALATMRPELLEGLLYMGSVDEICAEVAPLVDAGCRHFIVANVGASFMGEGVRGLGRLAQLMRRLRGL